MTLPQVTQRHLAFSRLGAVAVDESQPRASDDQNDRPAQDSHELFGRGYEAYEGKDDGRNHHRADGRHD